MRRTRYAMASWSRALWASVLCLASSVFASCPHGHVVRDVQVEAALQARAADSCPKAFVKVVGVFPFSTVESGVSDPRGSPWVVADCLGASEDSEGADAHGCQLVVSFQGVGFAASFGAPGCLVYFDFGASGLYCAEPSRREAVLLRAPRVGLDVLEVELMDSSLGEGCAAEYRFSISGPVSSQEPSR